MHVTLPMGTTHHQCGNLAQNFMRKHRFHFQLSYLAVHLNTSQGQENWHKRVTLKIDFYQYADFQETLLQQLLGKHITASSPMIFRTCQQQKKRKKPINNNKASCNYWPVCDIQALRPCPWCPFPAEQSPPWPRWSARCTAPGCSLPAACWTPFAEWPPSLSSSLPPGQAETPQHHVTERSQITPLCHGNGCLLVLCLSVSMVCWSQWSLIHQGRLTDHSIMSLK